VRVGVGVSVGVGVNVGVGDGVIVGVKVAVAVGRGVRVGGKVAVGGTGAPKGTPPQAPVSRLSSAMSPTILHRAWIPHAAAVLIHIATSQVSADPYPGADSEPDSVCST